MHKARWRIDSQPRKRHVGPRAPVGAVSAPARLHIHSAAGQNSALPRDACPRLTSTAINCARTPRARCGVSGAYCGALYPQRRRAIVANVGHIIGGAGGRQRELGAQLAIHAEAHTIGGCVDRAPRNMVTVRARGDGPQIAVLLAAVVVGARVEVATAAGCTEDEVAIAFKTHRPQTQMLPRAVAEFSCKLRFTVRINGLRTHPTR